ncbi:MAG: hypothetical protein KDJ73_05100 [Notoacmeibacter sp.]|nr:hypothetical protein [Notoacmeibacter sp.]MCC0032730.1 hypothetical protein [Brucellaceae bacterium]
MRVTVCPQIRSGAGNARLTGFALIGMAVLASAGDSVLAAQQGVPMTIVLGVKKSCEIVLLQEGALAVSPDRMTMSSQLVGGVAGRAQINTTSPSFWAYYDLPTSFASQPATNTATPVFSGTWSGTGSTTFTNLAAGVGKKLPTGTVTITIDLSAVAATAYAAGDYRAEATIRCE